MRLTCLPHRVAHRLYPLSARFTCAQAQHYRLFCWLLVSLIVSASGQLKALTRLMPSSLAYWTTLRMMRAQYWDEQALLELLVADTLYTLPPPRDGVLHLIGDTTRKEKTGQQPPLAYTTKAGTFAPYLFGHSVLLLLAQWGRFRVPVGVRVLEPAIKGHQNLLFRQMLRDFVAPTWTRQIIVEAEAGFAAKPTLRLIADLGYFYVFALPRTWKLATGAHLSDLARHLPKHLYRRIASSKPDGRRRDYWTFRRRAQPSALGDVTLILSKRRFNDPPHRVKLLVTNLPEASTGEVLDHFARRWSVEVTFHELKAGLHLGQMQVTKEEQRIQRSVALPVLAYLLLLRLYGLELKPDQGSSLFTLQHFRVRCSVRSHILPNPGVAQFLNTRAETAVKQRFIEEVYQEQHDRSERRWRKKLEKYRAAA